MGGGGSTVPPVALDEEEDGGSMLPCHYPAPARLRTHTLQCYITGSSGPAQRPQRRSSSNVARRPLETGAARATSSLRSLLEAMEPAAAAEDAALEPAAPRRNSPEQSAPPGAAAEQQREEAPAAAAAEGPAAEPADDGIGGGAAADPQQLAAVAAMFQAQLAALTALSMGRIPPESTVLAACGGRVPADVVSAMALCGAAVGKAEVRPRLLLPTSSHRPSLSAPPRSCRPRN